MQKIERSSKYDILDVLNPSFPRRKDIWWWGTSDAPTPIPEGIAAELQSKLRRHIDEWIDSGFDEQSREWPQRRNFNPRSNIVTLDGFDVYQVKDGKPVEEIPNAVSEMGRLFSGHMNVNPSNSGETLYEAMGTANSLNAGMDVVISGTGGVEFRPKLLKKGEPKLIAAWLFFRLYRSKECLFTIMRCGGCRGIFFPNRKSRERYVHGWHCPKCSKTSATARSVKNTRREQRERWFGLAVKSFQDWNRKPHRSTTDRIDWITAKVNERLPLREQIKRNRISRNLTAIEKKAR